MARWDDATVRQIRERTDFVALVSETVRLRRMGKRFLGLCPFHSEHTPSFNVLAERGLFHCFGCQTGGDVFDYVMRRDNLTFPEALEMLAARAGIDPPQAVEDPEVQARRRARERLYAALSEAERWYRSQYLADGGKAARAYVASRRIGAEVSEGFGLGYAPVDGGVHLHLGGLGYSPSELGQVGLGPHTDGRDRFAGRLVLPIRDGRGRTVGFGARALGDAVPKYLNSPEGPLFAKRYLVYGLDRARAAIRQGGEALVVEGYFDVLACHQAGFTHAVASLGTAFGRETLDTLRREAGKLVFAFDGDSAGLKAARAALEVCDGAEVPARAVALQDAKDPAEMIGGAGRDAFVLAVEGAQPRVLFLLEQAIRSGRAGTVEGKAEVAREVLAAVIEHPSPVARSGYLRELARRLEVPEESLGREMARLERRRQPAPARAHDASHRREKIGNDNAPKRVNARARREEELAALVLNAPDVARASGVDAGRFGDAELARLVAAVLEGGADAVPDDLRGRAAALMVAAADSAEKYPDPEGAVRDLWRRLEMDFARAQRDVWLARIAELERSGQEAPVPYLEAVRKEVRRGE